MKIFPMIIFPLNKNIIIVACHLFLLSACVSQNNLSKADLPPPYIVFDGGLVYDAAIQYKTFFASGLLVLKRIRASEYHVALLSKFGPTIMEFKLDEAGFHWIKTFDKLENKLVEKFIERDFRMLLMTTLENPDKVKRRSKASGVEKYKLKGEVNSLVYVNPATGNVIYTENKGFINLFKTKVNFSYNEKEVPETILIEHNNLNSNITLQLLQVIQN